MAPIDFSGAPLSLRPPSQRIDGLNPDDPGIRMLSEAVRQVDPREVLLVHCGDLPDLRAGATRLVLDVRETPGSAHSCVLDALDASAAAARFAAACVWHRAHLGMDFTERCLAQAGAATRPGGEIWCAARTQKGARRIGAFMQTLFGNVAQRRQRAGYRLFRSERDARFCTELAHERIARRYTVTDPALGDVSLQSAPGVFSRKKLDAGTRTLIEHCASRHGALQVARALDLCAGVGPLAIWTARRWPEARVLALDSNALAIALLRRNARDAGCDARIHALVSDGLPPEQDLDATLRAFRGALDLALVNPPTHATPGDLRQLLQPLADWMAPGAPALFIVNRPGRTLEALQAARASAASTKLGSYHVVEGRWPSSSVRSRL